MKKVFAILFILSFLLLSCVTTIQYPTEMKNKSLSVAAYFPPLPQHSFDYSGNRSAITRAILKKAREPELAKYIVNSNIHKMITDEAAVFSKRISKHLILRERIPSQKLPITKMNNEDTKVSDWDFAGIKDSIDSDHVFSLSVGSITCKPYMIMPILSIDFIVSLQNIKTRKVIWNYIGRTSAVLPAYGELNQKVFNEYVRKSIHKGFERIYDDIAKEEK